LAAADKQSKSHRNLEPAVKGDHVIPVAMELTQEGAKLTGTLMLPNGDFDLKGELAGNVLTFNGTRRPRRQDR